MTTNQHLTEQSIERAALRKVIHAKKKEQEYIEEKSNTKQKNNKYKKIFNRNKALNLYNESAFNEKQQKDFYIFDALCEKSINETSNVEGSNIISNEIGNLYSITKKIYEEFNIRPVSLLKTDIKDSENSLLIEGKKIINNFLSSNYYSVRKQLRVDAFKDKIVNHISEEIQKKNITEDKIEFEIHKKNKELLMTSFIERIIFPRNNKQYVTNELIKMKDNEYLNEAHLSEVVKSYETVKMRLAKMFSVLV